MTKQKLVLDGRMDNDWTEDGLRPEEGTYDNTRINSQVNGHQENENFVGKEMHTNGKGPDMVNEEIAWNGNNPRGSIGELTEKVVTKFNLIGDDEFGEQIFKKQPWPRLRQNGNVIILILVLEYRRERSVGWNHEWCGFRLESEGWKEKYKFSRFSLGAFGPIVHLSHSICLKHIWQRHEQIRRSRREKTRLRQRNRRSLPGS
jgi:hypothetical protein